MVSPSNKSLMYSLMVTLCIGISGCVTMSKAPTYDAAATETLGRVVSKIPVKTKMQVMADSKSLMSPDTFAWSSNPAQASLARAIGSLLIDLEEKKTWIPIYEYQVQMADGRSVFVNTDYAHTEIGECVKVFESADPSYPRFISHDSCGKIPVVHPVAPGLLSYRGLLTLPALEGRGWKVVQASPSGLAYGRHGSAVNESYVTTVSWFTLRDFRTSEEFVEHVKSIAGMDVSQNQFILRTSNYEYTEYRGYPCVKFSSLVDEVKSPRSSVLKLQNSALFCRHSTQKNVGFQVVFSHRGIVEDPLFEIKAQEYIAAVQVP